MVSSAGIVFSRPWLLRKAEKTSTVRVRMSASNGEATYTLTYQYVPDILEKRVPHRPGHIALCKTLADEGKMLLGGAFGDPPSGALFVIKGKSKSSIEEGFVKKDPYVENGLVTGYSIEPWTPIVGCKADALNDASKL